VYQEDSSATKNGDSYSGKLKIKLDARAMRFFRLTEIRQVHGNNNSLKKIFRELRNVISWKNKNYKRVYES
jgi:hypothetical protein